MKIITFLIDAKFQSTALEGKTPNLKGVLEIGYSVGTNSSSLYPILPACPANKNDTCYFKFWARDLAKNVSDTVISPDIIIFK